MFNETAMHARAQASNRLARANRASHGPRVRAKARVTRTSENPKESRKEPKVRTKLPKAHTRVKHRKLVYLVLKTRNQRQARKLRNLHKHFPLTFHGFMMDGVLTIGMMAGVLMNGMLTEDLQRCLRPVMRWRPLCCVLRLSGPPLLGLALAPALLRRCPNVLHVHRVAAPALPLACVVQLRSRDWLRA